MIDFGGKKVFVIAYCEADVDEFAAKNNIRGRWVTDPLMLRGLGYGTEIYVLPRYSIRTDNYLLLEEIQRDRLVIRMVRHDLVSLWDKPGYKQDIENIR